MRHDENDTLQLWSYSPKNCSIIIRTTADKSQLSDILKNIRLVVFKTVKVMRNRESPKNSYNKEKQKET